MSVEAFTAIGTALNSIVQNAYNIYSQEKWSKKNYELQKDTLDYAKYLNQNQTQMSVADALKAGINPLAMHGNNNMTTGNYNNIQAPQANDTLSGVFTQLMQIDAQEKINKQNNETALKVAHINAQSQEEQTKMKIAAEKEKQTEQNTWQKIQNEADRKSNELIAENNLSQKEASEIRAMNLEIEKTRVALDESLSSSIADYEKNKEQLQIQAWELYKQWKYGLAILGSQNVYTGIMDNLTEKLGNFGNSLAQYITKEGKNANSKLDYNEFKKWFNKEFEKYYQKPTRTKDIEQTNKEWNWKK